MNAFLDWDTRLFILLNQTWTSPLLDTVMPFLTDFDNFRVPLVLVLLAFLAKGSTEVRMGILFAILSVVVADQVASSGIKPIVERARPFDVIEGTRKLIGAHGFAFPSSHAANIFAAGMFLALRFRRWWPVLFFSGAVAYSRVYVGVHYPSDVVAGAALGSAIAVFAVAIERGARFRLERLFKRRRRRRREEPEENEDGES